MIVKAASPVPLHKCLALATGLLSLSDDGRQLAAVFSVYCNLENL